MILNEQPTIAAIKQFASQLEHIDEVDVEAMGQLWNDMDLSPETTQFNLGC